MDEKIKKELEEAVLTTQKEIMVNSLVRAYNNLNPQGKKIYDCVLTEFGEVRCQIDRNEKDVKEWFLTQQIVIISKSATYKIDISKIKAGL